MLGACGEMRSICLTASEITTQIFNVFQEMLDFKRAAPPHPPQRDWASWCLVRHICLKALEITTRICNALREMVHLSHESGVSNGFITGWPIFAGSPYFGTQLVPFSALVIALRDLE